ncbi:phosphorylase family protein [Chondromyces apiculatus]|uniref:Uncharacterized protein n=1 Tax=Chondromyces apiculatus DSM 436 TaxID=1192034 RepID=A0A017T603_9BACT|nr:hypothetical protein [Chondromyces apiculatus]EYF04452.1 Hypothetical protein CAP_4420 [Chondromyces apiculatus DSM 436]
MSLEGKFVGIDGSAAPEADPGLRARSHRMIRMLARNIFAAGGGIVTLVNGDPRVDEGDPDSALIFIWTLLAEVDAYKDRPGDRLLARVVGSPKTLLERIPAHQRDLWNRLVDSGRVRMTLVEDEAHFGGNLREQQCTLADALVVVGGGKGVSHLAHRHMSLGHPVIPLDAQIGGMSHDGAGAAGLNKEALVNPGRFTPIASEQFRLELSRLSFHLGEPLSVDEMAGRLARLLAKVLEPPPLTAALTAAQTISVTQGSTGPQSTEVTLTVRNVGSGPVDWPQIERVCREQMTLGGGPWRTSEEQARFALTREQAERLLDGAHEGLLDPCAGQGNAAVLEVHFGSERVYEVCPALTVTGATSRDVGCARIRRALAQTSVLMVTVTETERDALLAQMVPAGRAKEVLRGSVSEASKVTFRVGQLGRYRVAHVETTMGSAARRGALLTVKNAFDELKPKAVIAVGIAFGMKKKKQRLGDVLVAETMAPYELAKVESGGSIQRGQQLPCGIRLSERFAARIDDWKLERWGVPVGVHQGLVLCGEKVINHDKFRDELAASYPTAIGGEMEGAGVYAVAQNEGVEAILVKGICDWADGHKNDASQPFAAHAAVSLVEHVLGKPDVLGVLGIKECAPSRNGRTR